MRNLFIGLCLVAATKNLAQNKMVLYNGKEADATEVWDFTSNAYVYDSAPQIQIAKTATGGILKISMKVSNEKLYIGDRIFIILKNSSLIYCSDKGFRSFANGVATTYFILTNKEIQLLKNHEITDVRFKIVGERKFFDSQSGMFTASNILTVYDAFSPDKKTIDTKRSIINLFK